MPDKSKKASNRRQPVIPNSGRSRWWGWVVVGVLAVAALVLGYRSLGPTSQNTAKGDPAPIHEPALPQSGFTWQYRAYALHSGRPTYFTRGKKVTVVMLMASWCLYCAYVDKYVWPSVIHTPGLDLNLVDVSSNSGIGDPGPQTPAFSGHDNQGPVVGVSGMRSVMNRYVKRFDLTASNIQVFVEPAGLQYWRVQYFPTILFLNAKGQLIKRVSGGITSAQAHAIISSILKHE